MFKKSKKDDLVINLEDEEPSQSKFPTIKFLGKMIPLILVVGVVSYGVAYKVTNSKLDVGIAEKMKEIDEVSAEVDKAQESQINASTVPQEVLDSAITINVSSDTMPQELIEPSKSSPFRNSNNWYLVDTDGDGMGDAYWGISKDDIQAETYGKMYVYSYTDRNYIKHVTQESDPSRGIEEKYEMIPDPNQVIPPNVLVPAQFINSESGTILDYSKLD